VKKNSRKLVERKKTKKEPSKLNCFLKRCRIKHQYVFFSNSLFNLDFSAIVISALISLVVAAAAG
jgi:hypothetical protein